MGAAMVGIVAGMVVVLMLAEVAGMLWDSLWRFF